MTKHIDGNGQTVSARGAMSKPVSLQAARSTLEEAFRTAGGIEDCAGRVAVLARIAVLRQRTGDEPGRARALSGALAAVAGIDDDDARALALARIARARANAGDRAGWRETAARALAAIASGPVDGAGVRALDELAMAEAEAGDVAAALALAERCPEGRDRDRVLTGIAHFASARGEIAQAAVAARTIAASGARALRLAELARTRDKSGDGAGAAGMLVEALEAARQVANEFLRTLWLVEICRAHVAIGDLPGATRSIAEAVSGARQAEDERDRAHALCHIAGKQPGLGNLVDAGPLLDEASRAIDRIVDGRSRAGPLCELAEAKARIGDRVGALSSIAAALEATEREAGSSGWPRDVSGIAVAQAIAGEAGAARATARQLPRDAGNDDLLADICDGLCWINAVSDAVATAAEIVCARARTRTFVDIARYQAREGDPHGAGETIVLAREAADAVAERLERADALVEIAGIELEIAAPDGPE